MKQYLYTTLSVLLLIAIPIGVHAQDTALVWSSANTGNASLITINAMLVNDEKETVTYTVLFKNDSSSLLERVDATVAAGKSEIVSVSYKKPEKREFVHASVERALGKNNKELPALMGPIGDVAVGGNALVVALQGAWVWLLDSTKDIRTTIDGFRSYEATYFTEERDAYRVELGISSSKEAFSKMTSSPVANQPFVEDDATDSVSAAKKAGSPVEYAKLIGITSLASFFSSVTLFYVALCLIGFLVFRFLYRMFI